MFKPKGKIAWVMALFAVIILGNAAWTGAYAAVRTLTTDDSHLTEVFDYRPPHLIVRQGDPVEVSYLYTKRACNITATFSVQQTEGDAGKSYNVGPFTSSAPVSRTPRWVSVSQDINSEHIPPGEYTLTYFLRGTCDGTEGELPSSKELYQQGPVIPLTVLPVANG